LNKNVLELAYEVGEGGGKKLLRKKKEMKKKEGEVE
jgi:hypothetical protein